MQMDQGILSWFIVLTTVVVNEVVHPQLDEAGTQIASNILIKVALKSLFWSAKLFVDMYCSDGAVASQVILSILFEMLASSIASTRIHAFNLLFNLSVHIHLLEEISFIGLDKGKTSCSNELIKIRTTKNPLFHAPNTGSIVWIAEGDDLVYIPPRRIEPKGLVDSFESFILFSRGRRKDRPCQVFTPAVLF